MAQKGFEGDVVFSILIDREKIENTTSPSKTFWAISGTPVSEAPCKQVMMLLRQLQTKQSQRTNNLLFPAITSPFF